VEGVRFKVGFYFYSCGCGWEWEINAVKLKYPLKTLLQTILLQSTLKKSGIQRTQK
jgi:hypothetical protein